MKTDLDRNVIHLWTTSFGEILDETLLRRYRMLLSQEERTQERRFHFDIDRRRYLITRALVRTALSRYQTILPQDWRFVLNAYGRPAIAASQGEAARIVFNVSHTNSLILLGITLDRRLGVDVENDHLRQAPLEAADGFFAPTEVWALRDLPEHMQTSRFFEYWTLKESYIKARGMGLAIPLDGFSFHFPSEATIDISIAPRLDDHASRWWFWQFRPMDRYIAAVCAERDADVPPQVCLRHVVPLVSERCIAFHATRRSRAAMR